VWDIKYRPLVFSDVLGQEGNIKVLQSRLKEGKAFDTSYIFAGGHGCGKCVRGDTLVPTDRGLVPISTLMGPGTVDPLEVQIVGTDVLPSSMTVKSAYSYRGGFRETLKIRTYLGFELEGTPNHRIRVLNSQGVIVWRSLGDIQPGDYACISRRGLWGSGPDLSWRYLPSKGDRSSIPFEPPRSLDEDWGALMGFMVGDGYCGSRKSVAISCAESDVQEEILRILERLGGSAESTPDHRRPGLATIRCSRKQFRAFLEYLGVGYVGAAAKIVPWSVLASPEPVVRSFLRAYFECDGSVSGNTIEAVTKSEELARQLQVVLASLGIITRRYTKSHPKYGVFWRIRVMGTSVALFQEKIGFVSQRKRRQLADFVARKHAKGRRDLLNAYDVVPFQADHVHRFYEALPSHERTSETSHFFRCRHGGVSCTFRQVSAIVSDFPDAVGIEHFKHLLDSHYIFDPVEVIDPGFCEVFDLNVPLGESFVANGFANHNTTLARILARAMLCQSPREDGNPCNECDHCKACLAETMVAFNETDAASNATTDDMRQVVDDLAYNIPGVPKKIYLLDEAHRMSTAAQDVLLKPIEEKRVVFIFCTTEFPKIRNTISSRCEVYEIRKIDRQDILKRMAMVLEKEGVEYEEDAVLTVIDIANGHVRDVLNKLETVAQLGPVTVESVRDRLNLSVVSTYYEVLLSLGEPAKAVRLVEEACDKVGPSHVISGLAEAAMNSYRHAHKIHADFSMFDRTMAEQLYSQFGDNLPKVAQYFLKTAYPSKLSLVCDVVSLCDTGGQVVPQPMPVSVAAPVVVQAAPVQAVFPPPNVLAPQPQPVPVEEQDELLAVSKVDAEQAGVQVTQSPKVQVLQSPEVQVFTSSEVQLELAPEVQVIPEKKEVKPLTSLDHKAISPEMPRGSERERTQRTSHRPKPKNGARDLTPREFQVHLDALRSRR